MTKGPYFEAELCGPHVEHLRSGKRGDYWRRRGRGTGEVEREAVPYKLAVTKAEHVFRDANGGRLPYFGPVLVNVRCYSAPVKSGQDQGAPSIPAWDLAPAVVAALIRAGVIMTELQGVSAIATSHVSSETRIAVDVRQWEGT